MSSKTKIIVLRMKEIIYTVVFIGFAIFLVMLFLFMFRPEEEAVATANPDAISRYTPGLYSSPLVLGSQNVNVEVTMDKDKIHSISLVPLSDSVETMYPLMKPAMDTLAVQILENQSFEGIEYPAGSQYTSMALMQAVEAAVEKARQ